MFELTGQSIIGFSRSSSDAASFRGLDPSTGAQPRSHHCPTDDEVNRAAQLATEAFEVFGNATANEKAIFLRKIAENIEALGEALVTRATRETGLPAARIQAESGRTC